MKTLDLYRIVTASLLAAAAALLCAFAPGAARAQTEGAPLAVSVATSKESCLPGEAVGLKFTVTNVSGEEQPVDEGGVGSGSLRLFVSEDGKTFREYVGPGWGTGGSAFGPTLPLKPGAGFEVTATLLFNRRIQTEELSELYAGPIREERIDTDYAFTRPGLYLLKAVLRAPGGKTAVESKPVELSVGEPRGGDAAVWERLGGSEDYAFFMHRGYFLCDSATAERLASELTELTDKYPDSTYTPRIKALLEGLRGGEQPPPEGD